MAPRASFIIGFSFVLTCTGAARAASPAEALLEQKFQETVHPFVQTYCLKCHGKKEPEAELDLSSFSTFAAVIQGYGHWELALEKLESGDMPPKKARKNPPPELRAKVIAWIHAVRKNEAEKNAGDPGPVPPRRLSNAEYDYTIRDLTGADIRPTREFPVDPANQAGFDNSGESLVMSPALVRKYLHAARNVAEHLVLQPDGFAFAPHPMVADTDRDKFFVLRIVDFYKRQPTDYAIYFEAIWRFRNRTLLGKGDASLADAAAEMRISAKYLALLYAALTESRDGDPGPIARLRAMLDDLPTGPDADQRAVRARCEEMRDFVIAFRQKIVPEVKNLTAPKIQNGSQTLVMWKNRRMAANRRRYDPGALQISGSATAAPNAPPRTGESAEISSPQKTTTATRAANAPLLTNESTKPAGSARNQRPPQTPEIVREGGVFLPPALTTTGSSATFQMAAAKQRGADPDLTVPADPQERARFEAAFAHFADLFPDAFYITERARVYMDPSKEQKNSGRLLSAGLHSMTGFFRDDGPLYELILDDQGQRELDRLWQEFEFSAAVPMRMHTSFVWFERTDSSFMRDAEFDPFRPEDRSVTSQAKIKQLAELYLAKAQRNGANEIVQGAIREHFRNVAANIFAVEKTRIAAEARHLETLAHFASRAYRRPLAPAEKKGLLAFYREARALNSGDHEEALRDCIARVLLSPHFCFRTDLAGAQPHHHQKPGRAALSDHSLASRLSYFLWCSMPDEALLEDATAGKLQDREQLAAHARRMLGDGRLARFATEFGGNLLDFRRFEEHNSVDRVRYPAFDNELRQAMFAEPIHFLVHLIRENRSVLELIYGDYTFVNGPLAKHYGMPIPAGESDRWIRIEKASQYRRGGLLPMAVFLTANSPGLRTSPVKRGYWVVRRVLGERIPPPPAVVPDLPNDEADLGALTVPEMLAKHREDPSCAGCHARFDSFGLVFESYGALGESRENDFGGRRVESRAQFPDGAERNGLEGLLEYVREHREGDFINNLCRKLLAYGLGRTLIPSDDPLIDEMRAKLAANSYQFATLIECIVTSQQFRTRRSTESERTPHHAQR